MNYEVYCDESCVEALFDKESHKYAVIGGVWIPSESRSELKIALNKIKEKYNLLGEMKWQKISPSTIDMYKEIIATFFTSDNIRFRAICINSAILDHNKFNQGSGELGFYKFYYLLLQQWLVNDNTYNIFVTCGMPPTVNRKSILSTEFVYSSMMTILIMRFMKVLTDDKVSIRARRKMFCQCDDFQDSTGSRMFFVTQMLNCMLVTRAGANLIHAAKGLLW